MSGQDEFDYTEMAEKTAAVLKGLEAGLEKVRSMSAHGPDEAIRKNIRINLLEEEIMEQKSLYRLFRRRAQEKKQDVSPDLPV